MGKIAKQFLKADEFNIIEDRFDPSNVSRAESIFSLGNEYQGVRGFFEEGIDAKSLIGTYFNGIYEWSKNPVSSHYKGIIKRCHNMINSVNYLKIKITIDGETLDLSHINFNDYKRTLNLKTGLLEREFVWILRTGKQIKITFRRLLGMYHYMHCYQTVIFESIDYAGPINIVTSLDFSILHWSSYNLWKVVYKDLENNLLVGKTLTNQLVLSKYDFDVNYLNSTSVTYGNKLLSRNLDVQIDLKGKVEFNKHIINCALKEKATLTKVKSILKEEEEKNISYETLLQSNTDFFTDLFSKSDIEIKGDLLNQQGIRYCIFELAQTYHGLNEKDNIGAKGLTGEAYSGHAFWDTETYCLPYYLFNDPGSAKNLLMFRYHTLNEAKIRAIEVDCKGACYPIATLNGYESCDLWQHALTQIQPTTGVAYGIFHYVNVTQDFEFLSSYGIEMLIEISRFLISRGDFDQFGNFGYFGVMGPDEFQLMVNHDTYTNSMAKYSFEYLIESLEIVKNYDIKSYNKVIKKTNFDITELELIQKIISSMLILYNPETKLYEQHDGFYKLPHVDIEKIPDKDFPLYSNWSYDRLYRNDMIKQPSVLMLMFLYNSKFTLEEKLNNYNYYEPRTIHESSLSPSVHSILACETGLLKDAIKFFSYATRMDLDDYNNNTCEGLHTTSIAASWVNIVYGFGGLRSDSKILKLSPILPPEWSYYSFKINYRGVNIKVSMNSHLELSFSSNLEVPIILYDKTYYFKEGNYKFYKEDNV